MRNGKRADRRSGGRRAHARRVKAEPAWTAEERAILDALTSPEEIQAFLDATLYNTDKHTRSPRRVLRDRVAHCMEGALFAAAALERLGHPPLLVDLVAVRDDDHIIALFRRNGRLGAVAKSNYSGLRWRSPVYRTLRELVLSYFEDYFNVAGELTMRAWTRPLDMRTKRFGEWRTREDDLDDVGEHMDTLPRTWIVPAAEADVLRPVDERLYRAGIGDADPDGLFPL